MTVPGTHSRPAVRTEGGRTGGAPQPQSERTRDTVSNRFDDIERALADIAAGRPVIVVDDEDREIGRAHV